MGFFKNRKLFITLGGVIVVGVFLIITQQEYPCPEFISNKTEVLKEGVVQLDDKEFSYTMMRLQGKERSTYAVYFSNDRPETVMITRPYAGIAWACEPADKKRNNTVDIEEIASDSGVYLNNGFSVLNVFGRFYDGGDIENDINDMVTGLDFLQGKKVGITGSSWGGFEAVYASARSENKPAVGTAYYPPTDMKSWYEWTITTGEDEFFKPYQERILSATNGDYSKWNQQFLADNLTTDFLIYHAYEDTLVPVSQTERLTEASEKITSIFSHKKHKRLSHGEEDSNYYAPLEFTAMTAYMMRGLTDDVIMTLVDIHALKESEDLFMNEILLDKNLELLEANEGRMISYEEREEIFKKLGGVK